MRDAAISCPEAPLRGDSRLLRSARNDCSQSMLIADAQDLTLSEAPCVPCAASVPLGDRQHGLADRRGDARAFVVADSALVSCSTMPLSVSPLPVPKVTAIPLSPQSTPHITVAGITVTPAIGRCDRR